MQRPSILHEVSLFVSQSPLLIDGSEFEIFEKDILGHGSHGTLYRGRERSSSRSVAVRLLSADGQLAPVLSQLRRHARGLLLQAGTSAAARPCHIWTSSEV